MSRVGDASRDVRHGRPEHWVADTVEDAAERTEGVREEILRLLDVSDAAEDPQDDEVECRERNEGHEPAGETASDGYVVQLVLFQKEAILVLRHCLLVAIINLSRM